MVFCRILNKFLTCALCRTIAGWKNSGLPHLFSGALGGPSGNQTFLWSCAHQDSLKTLGTSLGQFFPDKPRDFPLFAGEIVQVNLKI